MKKRKKPTTEERRWFNMCESANHIREVQMIASIREHPNQHLLILSKLFAKFYSEYDAVKYGTTAARLAAMSKMLDVLNDINTYWKEGRV